MLEGLQKEVSYRTSRSGGAGGQHVNKVATKVELIFDVCNSSVLSEKDKDIILAKLGNRISQEGLLSLQCDTSRSQLKNKELVFKRFLELIKVALIPPKKRKPTKPSQSAIKKRLSDKKKHSDKKMNRKFREE